MKLILSVLICAISVPKVTSNCGKIYTDKQFVLTSENYPQPYPPDQHCFYLLKGENWTTHFNIEFLDFNLINSVGCVKDRLEIGSQAALCGMRNGSKMYISEKGSLKLKFVSDNHEKSYGGFRLLVSRVDDCHAENTTGEDVSETITKNPEITTSPTETDWTTEPQPLNFKPTYLPPQLQACCQNNVFSSRTFLLVSPNYPNSINRPTDCVYFIKKSSSIVCRLRIKLLFFALGPPNTNSCPYGHLEIDGKFICGCNSDRQLTTNFGSTDSKTIKFHSSGYSRSEPTGFVLEIIQDECQKSYSPEKGHFRFYRDQSNRIKWPYNPNINEFKLIREKSFHFQPDSQFGNVYKHFYFFAPEEEQQDLSWAGQDREETSDIEISTIKTLLTNLYGYQQCMISNENQLNLLQRRFGNSLKQVCKKSEPNINNNCIISSSLYGSLVSPGYPSGYGANQHLCYRFQMSPGYCEIRIHFNDFQTEPSYDCLKDYLAINQYRYCGNYLANKQVIINTERRTYQDLKFVSDVNYCGKGFSAEYQQVRCQKPDNNSITPPSNCGPEGKDATVPNENPITCGKVISDKYFIISNYEESLAANLCTYDITKYSADVCKIRLFFEHFNIPCETGSITINARPLCGELSGQSLTLDFSNSFTITHRRNPQEYPFGSSQFAIRGKQLLEECNDNMIPDPVRLQVPKAIKERNFNPGKYVLINSDPVRLQMSTVLTERNFNPALTNSDICPLIKSGISPIELAAKICDILKNRYNAVECSYVKAAIDIENRSKNSTIIRLLNEDAGKPGYKEIKCNLD